MQTFAEVQAASSAAYRTLGDLEWEVESTTVTHSFIFIFIFMRFLARVVKTWVAIPVRTAGIFYFPWHRHQIEGTNGF